MNIGPFTDNLIKSCIEEVKKEETRDKIVDNIIEPIISEVKSRYSGYIMGMSIVHISILIILIAILVILLKQTPLKETVVD